MPSSSLDETALPPEVAGLLVPLDVGEAHARNALAAEAVQKLRDEQAPNTCPLPRGVDHEEPDEGAPLSWISPDEVEHGEKIPAGIEESEIRLLIQGASWG